MTATISSAYNSPTLSHSGTEIETLQRHVVITAGIPAESTLKASRALFQNASVTDICWWISS